MRLARLVCALVCYAVISVAAPAQNLGTGLYQFGSFDSRGFDTVNLGNLNTHFEIPLVEKQGRGINFDYRLVYDGLIWSTVGSSFTSTWEPDTHWGFNGQIAGGMTGFITYTVTQQICGGGGPVRPQESAGLGAQPDTITYGELYSNYVYHEPSGRNHLLNYQALECSSSEPGTVSGNGSALDGSGISWGNGLVTFPNGSKIEVPVITDGQVGGVITDRNGNTITNNGNGVFTDTLGIAELTIGGSGTASSPLTYQYPITQQSDNATVATATLYYQTYTVQTNFQCSNITEYPATSTDLPDHLTLADGETYSFTYEPTPGISGAVTGRLASVTLPTGGTISYAYTAGCSGSGINADGSSATLTRTTSDGVRTYTNSGNSGGASTTTLSDETPNQPNQSKYQFAVDNGLFYETHRQLYQGGASGTPLMEQLTCYNGTLPPCDGAGISLPISQTAVLSSYNGGSQLGVNNTYDASGMLLSSTQMSGGTTLMSTVNTYNSLEEVTSTTNYDGAGGAFAYSYYGYDETAPTATSGILQHGAVTGTRGNLTSSHVSAGATYLSTTTAYYDTGVPVSTTTPNGQTQFGYDATQTFVTSTTLPTPSSGVSLATSASYDTNSGALLSTTGMNADQTTTISQYDRLLRPTIVDLPNSGQVTTLYNSFNDTEVDQPMGNGVTAISHSLTDSYGRLSRTAVYNGQSAAPGWYQVDYCYDAVGLLQFTSVQYQGQGFTAAKQCSGNGTSYQHDALGRVTSVTTADGTANYQYNGRAVKKTDVNGVQKIVQYDLLGRISVVCEISPAIGTDSPTTCGADIAGNGFVTSYSYVPDGTTTVTQGVQERIQQVDPAGRTVYTFEPERGTTTYGYTYNSTGLQVTRTRPQANQSNSSVTTTTTTQYDSLGRVVTVSYSDGTPTKTFSYDQPDAWGGTVSLGSSKGMLTQHTVNAASNWTGAAYGYDIMGRVNWNDQCTPSSCGQTYYDRYFSFVYDNVGNLTSIDDQTANNGTGVITSYSYSPASEMMSVTSSMSGSTYPTALVSNVQQGPFGPLSWNLGNGINGLATYDSLGRKTEIAFCNNGSTSVYCGNNTNVIAHTWATIQGKQVTSRCDTVIGTCNNFLYDQMGRLSGSQSFGTNTFTYVYDRYGNRSQQNALQGGPSPSYTFNSNNNQISGYGYDAAGNMTYDGFHTYTYDAEGNMTQVDGGSTAKYYYNALNQRVRADQGSTSREYVYDLAGRRLSTWDGNARTQIQGQYYWGSSPIAFYEGGAMHFQHQDWMGTERARTSYNGSIEGSYQSLVFGDGFTASGTDSDPYHFAQLDHDSESSTEHAQFRQYNSTQGRWMSPDPYDGSYNFSNPQSFNRYSYVLNRPLSGTDPSGLNCGSGTGSCNPPPPAEDGPASQDDDTGDGYYSTTPIDPGGTIHVYDSTFSTSYTDTLMYSAYVNSILWRGAKSGVSFSSGGGGSAPNNLINLGKNLFSNNCNKKFGQVVPGYSKNSFFNQLANAPIQQYPAGTPNIPDHAYGADADTAFGQPGTPIRLFPNFYGNSQNYQAFVLIHEGTHRYTGWTDGQFLTHFGPVGLQPPGGGYGTGNFTDWLQGGCKP